MDDIRYVLVTDDNEINSVIAQNMLVMLGLEADVADSGIAALERVGVKRYDCIFMDHIMPGIDGIETTRRIRKLTDAPVIALSGNLTEEVLQSFIEAGAQCGMEKPINLADMKRILRTYIPGIELRDTEQQENSSEVTELKRHLSSVGGLDYESGLKNSLGNESNYYHVVKASIDNIRKYIDMLEDYHKEENDEQLRLAAHSLKSVFANLGIVSLSSDSAELENIVSAKLRGMNESEQFDKLHTVVSSFTERISQIDEELGQAVRAYDSMTIPQTVNTEPEEPISAREMADVTVRTQTALTCFEIDLLIDGLETLKKASAGEKRKLMESAIEAAGCFDYDSIGRALTQFSTGQMGRGEAR